VQHRRAQGQVIRAEPGQDRRDADRVGDVGVAAAPELAPVTARRDIVGPQEELDVGIWPGGPEGLAQASDRVGRGHFGGPWVAVHGSAPPVGRMATKAVASYVDMTPGGRDLCRTYAGVR
jgi:hypothetical protein